MRPQDNDIELVIREALTRYEAGRIEHGQIATYPPIRGILSVRQSKSY